MTANLLYSELRRQGFNLVVRGDKLIVTPNRPVPPDLLATLRAHKAELLSFLATRTSQPDRPADTLRPDRWAVGKYPPGTFDGVVAASSDKPHFAGWTPEEQPIYQGMEKDWQDACQQANREGAKNAWLHIARQVLSGEFDGADRSTVESLIIGLRGIRHPACQQALDRINPKYRGRRQTG